MWYGVKVLKNSSKISDLTKTDVFQLDMSEINENLGWKNCGSGFRSVWDLLTRWFPKSVLKRELSGIDVTTNLSVNNFRENKAMKLIFSSKNA